MPYLNFETNEGRDQMRKAIRKVAEPTSRELSKSGDELCTDEKLIRAYLRTSNSKQTPPLHVRRTLDQFYYMFENTDARDQDQVVYRYTGDSKDGQIFMVDQLWLCILQPGKISKPLVLASYLIVLHRHDHHLLSAKMEAGR